MFRLDGSVTIVTGAASGIGEQIARALCEQGGSVVVADIDEATGHAVADDIGPSALYRRVDVRDEEDMVSLVAWTHERCGSVDGMVSCVGVGFVGTIEETPATDFRRLFEVNVDGVYYGCRAVIPHMLRAGHGSIVNVASVAGLIGVERRFAYCATKGAVIAMTRQLAVDYASSGIRANCVCPGTVHTSFVDAFVQRFHADEVEETLARLDARQPCGRMGRPEEIAALVVYLVSEDSGFLTGAAIPIDGGWSAG